MKQIWKYQIGPGTNRLQMPRHARSLTVRMQNGQPQLWALVDPRATKTDRRVEVVPTGRDFDDASLRYVGTVLNG